MAFKKGDQVRYVIPDIVGEVVGAQVDPETFALNVLVQYVDQNGERQQRYFKESELQQEKA